MTRIFHTGDADPAAIVGASVAVVGYGNQGRPWALNLRDAGHDVTVCVRADATRETAQADGFATAPVADASGADVICVLIPDDAIPGLELSPGPEACTVVASGYTLAYERIDPDGDVVMVAPRMLGPEVRECYLDGSGFITAVGVHRDRTGRAHERMLAVAHAIGGLRQGAIELTPMQETILDLAVEQVLSPALTHVNTAFVTVMLEHGIPLEAVMCELVLSGEVERTYARLRREGFAGQMEHHSPASQYGQLSRRGRFDHLDVAATMRELTGDITSGRFADEWDAERDAGHPRLAALKDEHCGPFIQELEADLRTRLGETATDTTTT
jgi:ketol-acid reductoisomerase